MVEDYEASMMEHSWKTGSNELDYCTVCGCCEGSTTTHCPGVHVAFETSQRVYHGEIDYRDGGWCNQPTPAMSHIYGDSREPYERVQLCRVPRRVGYAEGGGP
jgi:hypothetical protein